MTRHIAIVGSGPAGYYTAEAAQKHWGDDVRVDVFDTLPVPYGLIRTGVAPDHQSIKGVSRRYETTALSDNVRFVGNVTIGHDLSVDGTAAASTTRWCSQPARRTTGRLGCRARISPTCSAARRSSAGTTATRSSPISTPTCRASHAVVIGMGNVALDVARILSKTEAEFAGSDIVDHALEALHGSNINTVTIVGRRGPHQIMMTPKELGELMHLARAAPRVDPADLPAARR